eukprot:TRINITY_DN15145_c0_g1_i5.p1 TRINITY_DN15145_c0_g1~~TRINITY_DN15145_c0_g1_i5.p1  ORF type:complete len:365 (-),score=64.05 TRINITY_DN15145_c0_g1_i5:224-1231(-)
MENVLLLIKCLHASISILAWSLVILIAVQCIAGVLISQAVLPYLGDDSLPIEGRAAVFHYYGTFSRCMLSMFEITLANWAPACRVLVDNISEAYTTFFLVYRCVVGFCILNVVQAVFLSQTMRVAQEDSEVMIMQTKRAQKLYRQKLEQLFSQLDCSGDGLITHDEFQEMLLKQDTVILLGALGIESVDMNMLFKVLAGDDDAITIDEFIAGSAKIKGSAKNVEVIQIVTQLNSLQRSTAKIHRELIARRVRDEADPLRVRGQAAEMARCAALLKTLDTLDDTSSQLPKGVVCQTLGKVNKVEEEVFNVELCDDTCPFHTPSACTDELRPGRIRR